MRNFESIGFTLVITICASLLVVAMLAPPAPAADLENGKKVYGANCATCHGTGGKGDGPVGKYLDPKPSDFTDKEKMTKLSDADLKKVILEGKGKMPVYGGKLADGDVDDVIAHIRTFAGE